MRAGIVAGIILLLAGCGLLEGSDAPRVTLDADRSSYEPEQEVVLTLENGSDRAYLVHPELCGTVLQRWKDDTWRSFPNDQACTDVTSELDPGSSIEVRRVLPDSLETGTYRYMYTLNTWQFGDRYRLLERIDVFTGDFEVELE